MLASFWLNNLGKPLDGVPVEQNRPKPAKKGGFSDIFLSTVTECSVS